MSDQKLENLGYRESLEGLPEELLKTLSISKTKPIDQELIDIIKGFNGIATLDEIIIRRFRITGKIPDRQYVNNKLLNLVKRKLLVKIPQKKAVYGLTSYKSAPNATPVTSMESSPSPQTENNDNIPFDK